MSRVVFARMLACICALCGAAPLARAAGPATLRAGAAKVDITPPADAALPMSGYASRKQGFQGIHDNIYARALVLDDGHTQVALVAWELIFVPGSVWAETSRRIASETGIRPENLLLAAVHSHAGPALSGGRESNPATDAYTRRVENAAIECVKLAKARLQPARFGFAAGPAHVNVNRREPFPGQGLWLGFNETGPSDKTVAVFRFDDLAGKPIALLINYAVHAVVMGPQNHQISGDLAGATSRFVEHYYLGRERPRSDGGPRLRLPPEQRNSGEVVALWTSGAAGDQNPVSMESGEDFTLVNALGRVLGEAVVRAASGIATSDQARLRAAQRVVTCPGRRVEPGPTPRAEYKFSDADPVEIRLGLLLLGNSAIAAVSGEVLTSIGLRLKRESPFTRTILVTHANGSSGYIPDDAAYGQGSYEITATRLKPGCAESAIVNGLLEMMGPQ